MRPRETPQLIRRKDVQIMKDSEIWEEAPKSKNQSNKNTFAVGDTVKIVSTRDKDDIKFVGQLGTVIAVYHGGIVINEGYLLSPSTVVRRTDTLDKTLKIERTSNNTIEYSINDAGRLYAYIYKDKELQEKVDVQSMLYKYMMHLERVREGEER